MGWVIEEASSIGCVERCVWTEQAAKYATNYLVQYRQRRGPAL